MGSDEFFKKRKGQKRKRKENDIKMAPYRYLIVCEGKETEPNYFNGIKERINSEYGERVKVEKRMEFEILGAGRNTEGLVNYAEYIANRTTNYYGKIWVIFDKDDFDDGQFNRAIEKAHKNGYNVGWSNESIELWFLLHFEFLNTAISREQCCQKLSEHFRCNGIADGKYNKNAKNIFFILDEYGNIEQAIKWSEKLLDMHRKGGNCSPAKMKPATTLHELVSELKNYI